MSKNEVFIKMQNSRSRTFLRFKSLRHFFTFLFVPIAFSPIPIIIGTPEASCAYIIFIMGFFWVTETLPLPVTALIPTFAYPLLSVESAEEVSAAYLNDSNMIFFGSMAIICILAVAVESSRLHERIALRTLLFTGANPRFLMLGLQIATAFISLWMSNTSTTTMMVLPLVLALIKELDVCERLKNDPLSRTSSDASIVSQVLVISESKQQISIYKGLLLSIAYASAIGGIGTLIGTGSNIAMNSHFQSIYGDKNPVSFFSFMCYALPQVVILLLICWLWLQFLYIGFAKNDKKNNQTVDEVLSKKYKELGPMRYEEMTWLARPIWGKLFKQNYVSDGTSAMLISLLLFVLPSENPFSSTNEQKNEPIRTVMTWKLMREKFSWSTLFLLGGGFAMATGLTGLQWLPPWVFIAFSSAIVCCLTEFASNIATASVFIPMVASIAIAQHMNPLIYVLPVTFASSFTFMFPAGTPPNAIVFSAKLLHVSDMIIGGLVLKIFSFIICQVFAQTYAYLIKSQIKFTTLSNLYNRSYKFGKKFFK
ncbi:hypothetical protein Mgra_00008965 [Meloidogyne graminicola]|uniref:Uncharacterized protein n=1 Tax=Meloidogyne graminicola TaxID=189291 RepID=A0A8S9ZE89_9BILA|nr:hypothetical protein Mgra_00008965 [Meloidogyne graminicola]